MPPWKRGGVALFRCLSNRLCQLFYALKCGHSVESNRGLFFSLPDVLPTSCSQKARVAFIDSIEGCRVIDCILGLTVCSFVWVAGSFICVFVCSLAWLVGLVFSLAAYQPPGCLQTRPHANPPARSPPNRSLPAHPKGFQGDGTRSKGVPG